VQHVVRLSTAILDVPRHLSVHPGGFVLGEAPVDTLCAVEPATMPGRTVVQWDKQDIEDMGLFKVDLLGLGALSHIHQAFRWIAAKEHKTLTMATVPQEDPQTYAMMREGDTLGVFQIESRAQMAMLPRLKPETFYDLVVQVAIVRPGPIQGDMVHPYLRARQHKARPHYPHPAFAAILDKTYGVPIFQEQVMRLAILAANYSPDEADLLRRDMAAWRSLDRLEAHHARIVAGMVGQGVPQAFAERIFAQIRGFGEYGFPESHAASFAHIVYVTAYLRCRHKEAFTCGLLNAQPMGFYSPSTLIDDARRRGVRVLPIRLGRSGWDCEVVQDGADPHRLAVRMGLRYVRGLGARERQALALMGADVASLEEVLHKLPLHAGALCALARAGALDGLQQGAPGAAVPNSRRALLAQLRRLIAGRHDRLRLGQEAGVNAEARPELGAGTIGQGAGVAPWQAPLDAGENILWERRNSGHSTQGHPLAAWRQRLARRGARTAVDIAQACHGAAVLHGGLSICLQRPQTARGVTFLTLEDETGWVNVVVWLDTYDRYAGLIKTAPLLLAFGEVQRAGQVVHLVAKHFQGFGGL
jgi:error-prone DNA polymerase